MNFCIFLLIIVTSFCINFFYAMYVKGLAEHKMWMAAIYGECVVLAGALVTINYVNNPLYLIPTVIGGFVGTASSRQICKLLGMK